MLIVALACAIAVLASPVCYALYEDQKGSNNWLLQNVGIVTSATLLQISPVVVVNAQEGVLAAIHLRDGSIKWRRDVNGSNFSSSTSESVQIVGDAASLSAWDIASGELLWSVPQQTDALCLGGGHAYVLHQGALSAWSILRGSRVWITPPSSQKFSSHSCAVQGGMVHVVSWNQGENQAQAITISSDGIPEEAGYTSEDHTPITKVLVTGATIVALSSSETAICAAPVDSRPVAFKCTDLPPHQGPASLSAAGKGAAVHFVESETLVLVHVGQNVPVITAKLQQITAASDVFLTDSEALVAVALLPANTSPISLQLATYNVATGSSVYGIKVQGYPGVDAEGRVSPVAALWATPATSTTGAAFFRFLIRAQDGTLMFSQKGNVLWTRHGALARTQKALVVPLPATGNAQAPAPRPAMSVKDHLTLNALVLMVCFRSQMPGHAPTM
jgi:hypothetical protein